LQIFSTELHDWPQQLSDVYQLLDDQGKQLAGFKADLMKLYGVPTPTTNDDDSDDDDD
jgi:hypothetical protein